VRKHRKIQLREFESEKSDKNSELPDDGGAVIPSVKLRQLALSPSTLHIYKEHFIRMEHEDIHNSSLGIMDLGHAKRASLVQKSAEALNIGLNALG
jgi:hypothetical protein